MEKVTQLLNPKSPNWNISNILETLEENLRYKRAWWMYEVQWVTDAW